MKALLLSIAATVLTLATIVQATLGLIVLYVWGFGHEVPDNIGVAIMSGVFLTGAPLLFIPIAIDVDKHRGRA